MASIRKEIRTEKKTEIREDWREETEWSEKGSMTISVGSGAQPQPPQKIEARKTSQTSVQQTTMSSAPGGAKYAAVEALNIPVPRTGGHVAAEVKIPSGIVDKPLVEDNGDGSVTIRYNPREDGLHDLTVKYNNQEVGGSPFKIFVLGRQTEPVATAFGPGIIHGRVGHVNMFTVNTKGAGSGAVGISVAGPVKTAVCLHDNKDGTMTVCYVPNTPGEYKFTVKFDKKEIKGSPFTVKVTGDARKRDQITINTRNEVVIQGKWTDDEMGSLFAGIMTPSQKEEACKLRKLPNGSLGIEVQSKEIGEHVITVQQKNKTILSFKLNVAEKAINAVKHVKVSGDGLTEGKTYQDNLVVVDTSEAGAAGGIKVSMEGPSKPEIKFKHMEDGQTGVTYKPNEPGDYKLHITYADQPIPGSPFPIKVIWA